MNASITIGKAIINFNPLDIVMITLSCIFSGLLLLLLIITIFMLLDEIKDFIRNY